jgi:hypothetical protein
VMCLSIFLCCVDVLVEHVNLILVWHPLNVVATLRLERIAPLFEVYNVLELVITSWSRCDAPCARDLEPTRVVRARPPFLPSVHMLMQWLRGKSTLLYIIHNIANCT